MYAADSMGELSILLTVAGLALACFGVGVTAVTATFPELEIGKWSLHAAAVLSLIGLAIWLAGGHAALPIRITLALVIFGAISLGWAKAIQWVNGRRPNLVCLGDCDLSVELKRGIFREAEDENYLDAPRLVGIKFRNESTPPKKVGSVSNVLAHIEFYNLNWPSRIEHRVDYGCWLNERSPYVLFDVGTVHCLVIGTLQPKKNDNGFEQGFTIYENGSDDLARISQVLYRYSGRFRVAVEIVGGRHGQFGRKDEFELLITDQSGFEFYQLTDEFKQARREHVVRELARFVSAGEGILVKPIDINSHKFYQDAHEWSNTVTSFLQEIGGHPLSARFRDFSEITHHPYTQVGGFVDELYTQWLSLRMIASEYSNQLDSTSRARRLYSKVSKALRRKS